MTKLHLITLPIAQVEKDMGIKLKRNITVLGLDTACYDDKTEVFTNEGWKLFKDLNKTEKVVTLNPETKQIEYQIPTNYYCSFYEGELNHLESKNFDSFTTKNHKYYYKSGSDAQYKLSICQNKKIIIPLTGSWKGQYYRYFDLETISKEYPQTREVSHKINMSDWLEFLGWYLSEGSISYHRGNYCTIIYQSKLANRLKIRKLLKKIGFNFYETKYKFQITNKTLYEYIKNNCYSGNKVKYKTTYN